MSTHNLFFEQQYGKYQNFLSENFQFFGGEIFKVFEQACFRNVWVDIDPWLLRASKTFSSVHGCSD